MDKDKNQELSKIVVNLIRTHYESQTSSSDCDFLEASREAASFFEKSGNFQIAPYIRVLNGDDRSVFIPM